MVMMCCLMEVFVVVDMFMLQIFIVCLGLCISMEEAKKNMYAFSTTTYTGFQCTVDEATSEKFKGNVFIWNLS